MYSFFVLPNLAMVLLWAISLRTPWRIDAHWYLFGGFATITVGVFFGGAILTFLAQPVHNLLGYGLMDGYISYFTVWVAALGSGVLLTYQLARLYLRRNLQPMLQHEV